MTDGPIDQRIHVPTTKDQLERIDDWRRKQPDLPSRAEAIRRLIDVALKVKGK